LPLVNAADVDETLSAQTEIWSEDALKEVNILDEEADKRNPDLQDVRGSQYRAGW